MGIKHNFTTAKGTIGKASEWNDDHKIDGNVDFEQHEAENLVIEKGTAFPAGPVAGQLFYRTDLNILFVSDGSKWSAWTDAKQRFEYYITNDDGDDDIHGDTWRGQTFTTKSEKIVTRSAKLKLFRVGSPGTIIVSIKAVDGANHPTGADLAVGTIQSYSITDDTGGEWYEIFLTDYVLDGLTQYAIVVRALDGDASNYLSWRKDSAGATYAGGAVETSANAGVNWATQAGEDFMFEVWAVAIGDVAWEVDGADLQMVTSRPLDMRSQKIHNIVNPTLAQDAATKNFCEAVQTASVLRSLGTQNENLNMGSHKITGLAAPTKAGDAIREETKTLYWSATGNSFEPTNEREDWVGGVPSWQKGAISLYNYSFGLDFFLPVNLPHGAIVTRCIVYGNASSQTKLWNLYLGTHTETINLMASANIGTEDTTISSPNVNNENYGYTIKVSNLRDGDIIYGARITYTLDDPYA